MTCHCFTLLISKISQPNELCRKRCENAMNSRKTSQTLGGGLNLIRNPLAAKKIKSLVWIISSHSVYVG